VRLGAAEEAAIYARLPRRKVPGLVRAWLLLEAGDKPPAPTPARARDALVLGRILVRIQEISRRLASANLAPLEAVKLQAILLALLVEMEA